MADVEVDVEAVLRARARALARPLDDADTAPRTPLLVLRSGELRLGVALHHVLRVAAPGRTARVPGRGHALAGLRAVGGDLVAVADAGALLGAPAAGAPDDAYAVVLEHRDGVVGLLADAVEGVAEIDAAALRDAPAGAGALHGVTADGVLVVDVEELLADARLTTVAHDTPDLAPRPSDGQARPATEGDP